ncbi:uncharacterized protein B0T15DRAFT_133706 [Chaetomium strumarium]|uniref:Uncharacterized protein n=1 Tax=Chaetomium strumarium TaxID=1170767 RepID=A0AAJ0GZY7_9PEZI|nr:hypothetical protein B0T15DRAFT_133706 [Chaetomium strumarium]
MGWKTVEKSTKNTKTGQNHAQNATKTGGKWSTGERGVYFCLLFDVSDVPFPFPFPFLSFLFSLLFMPSADGDTTRHGSIHCGPSRRESGVAACQTLARPRKYALRVSCLGYTACLGHQGRTKDMYHDWRHLQGPLRARFAGVDCSARPYMSRRHGAPDANDEQTNNDGECEHAPGESGTQLLPDSGTRSPRLGWQCPAVC